MEACFAGVCGCTGGRRTCGSGCIDTRSNAAHCGACSQSCGAGESCVDSACRRLSTAWSRALGRFTGTSGGNSSVVADGAGNVYVAGSFAGTLDLGGGALTSAGALDVLVASYTAAGVLRWAQRLGGAGADSATGLAADSDGNLYLVGGFEGPVSFGGDTLTSAGAADVFVVSLSSGGAHRWSRRFGSYGEDVSGGVAVDGAANVAVTGRFAGSIDFGGGSLAAEGSSDGFIATFTGAGAHRWSRRFGSDDAQGTGVASDSTGNVYVSGRFRGSASFGGGTLLSTGGFDAFVVSLDPAGAHRWSRGLGGDGDAEGQAVAVDSSGNTFVSGSFRGTLELGGGTLRTPYGVGRDLFFASFAASGSHRWSRAFGANDAESSSTIAVDVSGNLIAAGEFRFGAFFPEQTLYSSGGSDVLAISLSNAGQYRWSRQFGASTDDGATGIAVDRSGDLLLAGYFNGSTVEFGAGPVAGSTSAAVGFVVKLRP
jgi:hypothetical protein